MRFAIRRVVVLKIARNWLNIRFGHCTSCLFDNSSVKLCKHDTPLLFAPSGANHEQGLGLDRVCVAMKAPVGLLSGRAVLRSKMEGLCPDKLGGICDKGYHGLRRASRWFCKFYCSKAVIVGLIFNTRQETISVSHIVMFAEKTYNAFEPVGHTKCRKERES